MFIKNDYSQQCTELHKTYSIMYRNKNMLERIHNTTAILQQNIFENVVCKMVAICLGINV